MLNKKEFTMIGEEEKMKKIKESIQISIELLFLLEKYLDSEVYRNNYFYQLNKSNYYMLSPLLKSLSCEEISFLRLYFDNRITIKKKLEHLSINRNDYYYRFKKIMNKISDEGNKNGIS